MPNDKTLTRTREYKNIGRFHFGIYVDILFRSDPIKQKGVQNLEKVVRAGAYLAVPAKAINVVYSISNKETIVNILGMKIHRDNRDFKDTEL